MKYEHSTRKLDFLLHFGASSLVWFIYLPIVAIVAMQVNPLWRYKLLLGMYVLQKRLNKHYLVISMKNLWNCLILLSLIKTIVLSSYLTDSSNTFILDESLIKQKCESNVLQMSKRRI